jgi:uncharacterized protein YjbI with pentapeptide repeats
MAMTEPYIDETFADDREFRNLFANPPNLSGHKFIGCRFEGLDMAGAILCGGEYQDVHFKGCTLTSAQLQNIDFTGEVSFYECRLCHANLIGVLQSGTSLEVARLMHEARCLNDAILPNGQKHTGQCACT